jgi:hypothetical protein
VANCWVYCTDRTPLGAGYATPYEQTDCWRELLLLLLPLLLLLLLLLLPLLPAACCLLPAAC